MSDANDSNGSDAQIPTTISNYKELYRAFLNGATSGSHRKLRIERMGDRTVLVAYNKWVYATREVNSGYITLFDAWTDKERATGASNIQFGYLEQTVEELSGFRQMVMVERESRILDVEGNEYESFNVSAPLA